jgi:hypothetical protein
MSADPVLGVADDSIPDTGMNILYTNIFIKIVNNIECDLF